MRDPVASLGHARSVRRRVAAGRAGAGGQKTRDSPGGKCHPAVRGQGARWHHSPQAFLPPPLGEHRFAGNTVFRGTPALREHRLVGQAFVMHEPPMARLPACEQLPADVVIAHAKNVREQYDATRR